MLEACCYFFKTLFPSFCTLPKALRSSLVSIRAAQKVSIRNTCSRVVYYLPPYPGVRLVLSLLGSEKVRSWHAHSTVTPTLVYVQTFMSEGPWPVLWHIRNLEPDSEWSEYGTSLSGTLFCRNFPSFSLCGSSILTCQLYSDQKLFVLSSNLGWLPYLSTNSHLVWASYLLSWSGHYLSENAVFWSSAAVQTYDLGTIRAHTPEDFLRGCHRGLFALHKD